VEALEFCEEGGGPGLSGGRLSVEALELLWGGRRARAEWRQAGCGGSVCVVRRAEFLGLLEAGWLTRPCSCEEGGWPGLSGVSLVVEALDVW
jgi:hypothetical protein